MSNKSLLSGLLLGIGTVVALAFFIPPGDSAIPPTPAFMNIATNDTNSTTVPAWVNATRYDDNLWIVSDGSILIEVIQYDDGPE